MSNYFEAMDRYMAPREENRFLNPSVGSDGGPNLAKPVVPISKLGTTFAEKGQGQNSTVLSNMLASIRQGTGQLQLAIQTPTNAQIGGGISSIGKDQRQAIKEVIMASEVQWEGLEMPTSNMSNLSGFDPQQGGFQEAKRKDDIQHVKDAIVFSAEIGAGGGVDIWSQEFSRDISDASFHKKDNTQFQDFEGWDENKHANKLLVDDRTGQAIQVSTKHLGGQNNPVLSVPVWKRAQGNGVGPDGNPYQSGDYLDAEGNKLKPNSDDKQFIMNRVPEWDPETAKFESKKMEWSEFKDYAQQRNQEEGVNRSPEEWWHRIQLENQYAQQRATSLYHSQRYTKQAEELKRLIKAKQEYEEMEKGKSREEMIRLGLLIPDQHPQTAGGQLLPVENYVKKSKIIEDSIFEIKQGIKHTHEASGLADANAEAIWENIQHIKPVEDFAKEKTSKSYAELGIYSMEETQRHNPISPIYVGPELGWPQAYGGHTEEFIDIIQNARKEMIKQMKADEEYAKQYNEQEMKEMAKKHIRGVLDTAHLSMWFNHFPKEHPRESEASRLERFNGWFMKQMDRLAEEDVVGSVQIVDSATGDHRHLPVGQGIFPTVDAVKRLQKGGYKGAVVSEGHEDEPSNPGSTQFSLWSEFGASMGSGGYHFAAPGARGNSFGNIYGGFGGAAGYRAPPNYIVGGYAPSNEWKLWSEVQLE